MAVLLLNGCFALSATKPYGNGCIYLPLHIQFCLEERVNEAIQNVPQKEQEDFQENRWTTAQI